MVADAKRREARKRKFAHLQSGGNGKVEEEPQTPIVAEKSEISIKEQSCSQGEPSLTNDGTGVGQEQADANAESTEQASAKHRFICFIGNLPYTATKEAIKEHFKAVNPSAVRHGTEKGTGKSRGFAFLEFTAYSDMQKCIQSYHHSDFASGNGPARRINVELTVGGGANSKRRKTRIDEKNKRLASERRKKQNQRQVKEKPGSHGSQEVEKPDAKLVLAEPEIHPSRRSRVTQ